MSKYSFFSLLNFIIIYILNTYFSNSQVVKPSLNMPKTYICYYTSDKIIIDGIAEEKSWSQVPYTDYFVDIEGDKKPNPYKNTRLKMLWDKDYFYILADMEEDHIWAKLKQRDTVIFYDNDFEVFIDPDGDTHNYYEFEVNAMGTYWDLFLSKPYRDKGLVLNSWDIKGIKIGIDIKGTLNNPYDKDEKWVLELAIPWDVLREAAKDKKKPKNGDQWRVNFSRVQWKTDIVDGNYVKKKDKQGKILPEDNWVWSPQGEIAMHMPEHWGYVQFSSLNSGEKDEFEYDKDEFVKQILYKLYKNQRDYFNKNNMYSSQIDNIMDKDLEYLIKGYKFSFIIDVLDKRYQIYLKSPFSNKFWYIREDGKTWYEIIK